MDYIKRMNMVEMFQEPTNYRPPETVTELAASVDYPNLNSKQYRLTRKTAPLSGIQPCLEKIVRNSVGEVIIAGNNYMGRYWGSSFYGWKSIEEVPHEAKACFRRHCRYSITAIKFTKDPNLFLSGNDKGAIELWSIRNPARGDGYQLYLVDSQSEHIEGISAIELLEQESNQKLVTGSHDGCLKVWDYGADLHSVSTMTLAHSDELTGLSTDKEGGPVFVSSSLDRSTMLWDLRKPRPALALFEGHRFGFTCVYWSSKSEANHIIAVGDDTGAVRFIDPRQPNSFLDSVQVFERKVHAISFDGSNFAVLGNTNQAKFYDEKLNLLHECSPSTNYLRDVLWDERLTNGNAEHTTSCWLIGWNTFIQRVQF